MMRNNSRKIIPSNYFSIFSFFLLFFLQLTCLVICRPASTKIAACSSSIFCTGPILHAVELAGIFSDSKTFVDRPLRVSPEEALSAFAALGPVANISQTQLRLFVKEYFDPAGSDLMVISPADYKPVAEGGLPVYREIRSPGLQQFAADVHSRWRDLGREVAKEVSKHPDRHSIISLPYPFIVPGGRFRELYYWDTFWTVQGLLVSDMHRTAFGMLLNFANLIDKYGHVLNGNRVYYIKRSEPPMLALMVDHFVKHPNVPSREADALIKAMLPALEEEYTFWMTERSIDVTVPASRSRDGQERTYTLNRYTGGLLSTPRPESYYEDYWDAKELMNITNQPHQSSLNFHENVAAAAESGMDFSTRWLDKQPSDFYTIRTQTILPVDLNALLCAQENILSDLFFLTGDEQKGNKFRELALDRGDALEAVFWNSTRKMFFDYDLKENHQREAFYLSGIVPIFSKCNSRRTDVSSTEFLAQALSSPDLQKALSFPGGFPTSFIQAEGRFLQWDWPNAWPPLQLMLIEGFNNNPEYRDTALQWAQKWLNAVYTGYFNTSHIYEKYDSRVPGAYGSGGEYVVQEGFGWTNGGILRLIELFPRDLTVPCCEFPPVGPDYDPKQVD